MPIFFARPAANQGCDALAGGKKVQHSENITRRDTDLAHFAGLAEGTPFAIARARHRLIKNTAGP